MTSPSTIPQRFIPKADELGVVAVGFSGGQVSTSTEPEYGTFSRSFEESQSIISSSHSFDPPAD